MRRHGQVLLCRLPSFRPRSCCHFADGRGLHTVAAALPSLDIIPYIGMQCSLGQALGAILAC